MLTEISLDHRLYVASPVLQCLSRRHLAQQSDPEHYADLHAAEVMQRGKCHCRHSQFSVLIAGGQPLQGETILCLECTNRKRDMEG